MEKDNLYEKITENIGKQVPIEDIDIVDPAEEHICISCE